MTPLAFYRSKFVFLDLYLIGKNRIERHDARYIFGAGNTSQDSRQPPSGMVLSNNP
jgi:hypothetical protein